MSRLTPYTLPLAYSPANLGQGHQAGLQSRRACGCQQLRALDQVIGRRLRGWGWHRSMAHDKRLPRGEAHAGEKYARKGAHIAGRRSCYPTQQRTPQEHEVWAMGADHRVGQVNVGNCASQTAKQTGDDEDGRSRKAYCCCILPLPLQLVPYACFHSPCPCRPCRSSTQAGLEGVTCLWLTSLDEPNQLTTSTSAVRCFAKAPT